MKDINNPDSYVYKWDTPKHNWHNVRVLCDNEGLSYNEKNLICSCIYQESGFNNNAKNENNNKNGKVWSTDWGIVQINDYWHIGANKLFPSVQYVKDNPQVCVKWMIDMYLRGRLSLWASYSTGAYRQWLKPNSKMWSLKK